MSHPLLTAPLGRSLFRLAGPTTAIMLVQIAVALAETWFLAELGTASLAGSALVVPAAIPDDVAERLRPLVEGAQIEFMRTLMAELPPALVDRVAAIAVAACAVKDGTIASSNGSAITAPVPRRNVRRSKAFLVIIIAISSSEMACC